MQSFCRKICSSFFFRIFFHFRPLEICRRLTFFVLFFRVFVPLFRSFVLFFVLSSSQNLSPVVLNRKRGRKKRTNNRIFIDPDFNYNKIQVYYNNKSDRLKISKKFNLQLMNGLHNSFIVISHLICVGFHLFNKFSPIRLVFEFSSCFQRFVLLSSCFRPIFNVLLWFRPFPVVFVLFSSHFQLFVLFSSFRPFVLSSCILFNLVAGRFW